MDNFLKKSQPDEQTIPEVSSGESQKAAGFKSRRGAWKTSSVVLLVIGISVALIVVIGSVSLMYFFWRYERPSNVTQPTQTQETTGASTQTPSAKDTTKDEPTKDTTDKASPSTSTSESTTTTETTTKSNGPHFTVPDAATRPDAGNRKALTTTEIASKVSPATVSILANMPISNSGFGDNSQDGSDQMVPGATGTGFLISADGYIVTNNHVIAGADSLQVILPGEKDPIDAKLVGTDPSTDIAVLKIDKKNLPYVTLGDSDTLQVGELAVAIGNPYGELAGTMTAGIISALNREITIGSSTYNLIQTDASINSGNSGGPLVNSYGEVIGVTNAKVSGGEGLGFAIPINDIKSVIEDLINNGYVKGRPTIGIGVITVDEMIASQYDWPTGAYIRQVATNGAADKAGMKVGDIITQIDGKDVTSSEDVNSIKNEHKVGDKLKFTVWRNGDTIDLTLTLQESAPAN